MVSYEVEVKHRVIDAASLRSRLGELGVRWATPVVQIDTYLAHPARNFAESDEAFRIRQVGDANCVTYKGPKIDNQTKTRREIELEIGGGTAEAGRWMELLEALGFGRVAQVRKTRTPFALGGTDAIAVAGAWDEIEELGIFVELELTATDAELDSARSRLTGLTAELNLGPCERRSYLELLLARGGE